MNIFVLNTNPTLAAQAHCDIHLRKMIVETCQLLSTYHRKRSELGRSYRTEDLQLMMKSYRSPIFQKWFHENFINMQWTTSLLEELAFEYSYRFGYKAWTEHKCYNCVAALSSVLGIVEYLYVPQDFVLAMPEDYLPMTSVYKRGNPEQAVKAYRSYYSVEKFKLFTYTRRTPPDWLFPFSGRWAYDAKKDMHF